MSSSPDDESTTETLPDGTATPHVNGKVEKPTPKSPPVDDNPYTQIIESLRSQNNELFAQVTALNSKLVQSYDRVSDLEDNDHVTQSTLRNANLRIAQLEMERMEHLSALDTGLLVERAHVTTELTRLMEKVSEEAAQRGVAENAKDAIEKDLDDLSATLFNQANTMVAEARFARAQSEKKAAACEVALKSAEEAMAVMQTQMQTLTATRDAAEREKAEMRELMDKGKWVERKRTTSLFSAGGNSLQLSRLLNAHAPYEEFMAFVAHLRQLRSTIHHPPAFPSLISLPFLARLIAEDSDPTLRLDLAPSLNWLTRRSISSAVQQGQLMIEPMPSSQFTMEVVAQSGVTLNPEVCCALCGKSVLHIGGAPPPSHPSTIIPTRQNTWATTSRFFRSSLSVVGSAPTSRNTTAASTPPPASPSSPSSVVYIFRLSLPPPQRSQPYAVCPSGWCLMRLRSTCELWRYIRLNIVEKVWEEVQLPAYTPVSATLTSSQSMPLPPVPPRRKSAVRVGSLWEKGLGALGVDVSGATSPSPAATTTMTRHSTAPAPTSTSPASAEATSAPLPPPPPPRKVPPPPLPNRSVSRPNITTSPKAAQENLPDTDDFVTPRSSMEKEEPKKDEEAKPSTEEPEKVVEATPEVLNEEAKVTGPVKEREPATETKVEEKTIAQPVRPASPFVRPGTPRSTELPPSAPSTPNSKSVGLPGSGTPSGSSPAPPPVPRRAAARRVVPPVGGRPRTPSPRTSLLMLGKERDGELQRRNSIGQAIEAVVADGASPQRRTGSPSRPATPPGPRNPARPKSPSVGTPRSSSPSPQSDKRKSASLPAPVPAPTIPEPIIAPKPLAANEMSLASPIIDHAPPPPLPPRSHPPPPIEVGEPPVADTKEPSTEIEKDDTAETIKEEPTEKTAEPEDDTMYVSDRTWEERAWKEIVKLRLDMFWARAGSVAPARD